ncbi:MAG: deoxyribodipyrimidine photo-lyase [Fimbriimonadaceae bacterium]|nr:deoxyribodipyrimidine photo-lyase [Fimbriimonadaceae bacterium]QYK56225.1 MAG: deoxyribodipyrimidine photo-lyase [Fimbriimonadaceae bacterium]
MPRYKSIVCWLRRDLRLEDNTALAEATRSAEHVAVAFVYDREILDPLLDRDDRRVTFIHESVGELERKLAAKGSGIVTLYGTPGEEIPRLAEQVGAEAVFASHDDDPYALTRDHLVKASLKSAGREFYTFKDIVVFERTEVLNQSGEPFKVFTPYSKAWKAALQPPMIQPAEADTSRLAPRKLLPSFGNLSLDQIGFQKGDLWLEPGEDAALRRLEDFFAGACDDYAEMRDFPGIQGTSGLSVHLRHGTVSIRQCFRRAYEEEGRGAAKWIDELIWREFYHMILANFPNVVQESFRPEYRNLEWPGSDEDYRAWEEGRTGYPIVDAAMRCLNATGWMHNRLRMVTAMFLTKDLLVDYRKGEAYFARKLLDFELSSNNGGWQWSASTGVDAQPYFRIFNPVLQSKKFDPEGKFIKTWCPELKNFSPEHVHWPSGAPLMEQQLAGCEVGKDYPLPIVDHGTMRERAVKLLTLPS